MLFCVFLVFRCFFGCFWFLDAFLSVFGCFFKCFDEWLGNERD